MYKSYICHPINYPKNMLENYKDIFLSIKKKIVNGFIRDGFKSKTQGLITANVVNANNQTHSPSFSSTSPQNHSYLERMPVIDTTPWYSPFFTTIFYWISYDLIERLIYKGLSHCYFNNINTNGNGRKGKELQRKPLPNRQNSQSQSQSSIGQEQTLTDDSHSQNSSLPPTIPPSQDQSTSSQSQSQQQQPASSSQSQPQSQTPPTNKERQNNGRSPQHAKVLKTSTTMLKRVYIDVFCRLASSVLTKVITYPIDTICVKLLTNGSEIKPLPLRSSSAKTTTSFSLTTDTYPLLNKEIHGFWSCCQHIYHTKGILGFYENFLYGMIPEILLNTIILEVTYYATNYLLNYVETKYEIIPKSKYRNRKRSKSKK